MSGCRCRLVAVGAMLAIGAGGGTASAASRTTTYDSFNKPGYSVADYEAKWSNPFGPLELAGTGTRDFEGKRLNVRAAPFSVGADFSVFDHLKYIGTSDQVFAVPGTGSVEFSTTMTASTPGTVDDLTVNGLFGGPGSWSDPFAPPAGFDAAAHSVLQGQQAGVVLNMVDFCTGQLFDWFLAEDTAFTLIERLPSNVTGNTSNPNCPGATHVGREEMYTQIIDEVQVKPGAAHTVSIRFNRKRSGASVDYFLDGRKVSHSEHIGVPLDVQGVPYTGIYPSLGHGEDIGDRISSFTIGHGLFSLLDVFPFQHPEAPELSVSIPVGSGDPATAGNARLFGQGAIGSWDNFTVTTESG